MQLQPPGRRGGDSNSTPANRSLFNDLGPVHDAPIAMNRFARLHPGWPLVAVLGLVSALALIVPQASSPADTPLPSQASLNDLDAWRAPTGQWEPAQAVQLDRADPTRFEITGGRGILVNGRQGRTVDLLTRAEYGDVEVSLEFCITQKSNSGVYLMGRYEVQIYDSHAVVKDKYPGIECAGIYPRWTEARGEFEFPARQVSRLEIENALGRRIPA